MTFSHREELFFLALLEKKTKRHTTRKNFPFLCVLLFSFIHFISTHEKQLIDDTRKKKKKDGN